MGKKETKSTDWQKSKTTLTQEEKSDRGIKSATQEHVHKDEAAVGSTHRMAKFAESMKADIMKMYPDNKKKADAAIDATMSRLFGNFWDMSSQEYATLLKKHGFGSGPVSQEAAMQFQEKFGQNPLGPQGAFVETAKNISDLKVYEDAQRKVAGQKGLKGEAFGFSGGYGKGKVRAGVSADMDAKNEEALGNSGLLG